MDCTNRVTRELFYELSERKRRVSVDLDSFNQFKLLKTFFNLRYLFPSADVQVEVTRHGFHVKALGVKLNAEQKILVRYFLGDDAGRLVYDEIKHALDLDLFVDVLFNMKKDSDGSWGFAEPYEVLNCAFWSKLPARKRWLNGNSK